MNPEDATMAVRAVSDRVSVLDIHGDVTRARRQRQRLLAYGINQHYRQIFELTRLDEAIGIHDTETAALAAADAPEGRP